jgi:hypothetical protein
MRRNNMRPSEVEAALAGLILIGTILSGAHAQEVPLDFFVDPETSKPNVVVVVGSTAASEDVVSATMMAAVVGTMCTRESEAVSGRRFKAAHENISPADYCKRCEFSTSDVPDAQLYRNWEDNLIPINYTLPSLWYFDDFYAFWGYDYGHFQPWETHEEIQILFDLNDGISAEPCLPCLFGISVADMRPPDELDLSNWPRVPGLVYRADNIFAPPSISVEMWFHPQVRFPMGPRIFYVPEPWMVMQGMLPQFKLFNTIYTVVDAGPLMDISTVTGERGPLYGTPCLVTGEPHFKTQIHLYVNSPLEFGSHTVEVVEVDIDQSRVLYEVSENGELLDSFWMRSDLSDGFPPNLQNGFPFDTYYTCSDADRDSDLDPGEATSILHIIGGGYEERVFEKWVVNHIEGDIWVDFRFEYYVDDLKIPWGLFSVVRFALDGVRVFTDDRGTGVEIQVYWLENEEIWYNHVCSDPWTANPDYQLFLDAYQAGWDEIHDNSYLYQPPGTGLWPPMGLNLWKSAGTLFIGNGFLDSNDGHTGYEYYLSEGYFPEQYDLDRDKGTTNDCRNAAWEFQESCQNQHDIEDPVVQHGAGVILVELNICLCDKLCSPDSEDSWVISGPKKEQPYFTIEVLDVNFCDDGIDYNTLMKVADTTKPVDIDETGLVFLDTDIDFTEWKSACRYNLILIGGPVANTLVNQLMSEGISTVNWTSSTGEWEYIVAPYNDCHILIVAGSDRDATRAAVLRLIDYLET